MFTSKILHIIIFPDKYKESEVKHVLKKNISNAWRKMVMLRHKYAIINHDISSLIKIKNLEDFQSNSKFYSENINILRDISNFCKFGTFLDKKSELLNPYMKNLSDKKIPREDLCKSEKYLKKFFEYQSEW